MSDEDGPATAAIVVVVDEVVEVLEVELVVVERCVVVVLRCVVVVRGAWVVVVGALVVVVGATVVVVEAVAGGGGGGGGGGSSAPAGPTPMPNIATMSSSTAPPRAATAARRGVDGRITGLTLDRRCLLAWSVIGRAGRLPLMVRAGIGGAATNRASQKHHSIGWACAATMARVLQVAHM